MPQTLAPHFRWDEITPDFPMEKIERRRVIGENVMISQVFLEEGCDVPTHAHDNEQIACVLSGRVRFGIGAEGSPERYEVTCGPGEVLHLPPGVLHSAFAEEDSVVLDVFSPTSAKTGIDRED